MPMTSPPATYAPASWLYPVDLSVQPLIAAGELLQPNRRQAWREETHVHGLRGAPEHRWDGSAGGADSLGVKVFQSIENDGVPVP